MRYVVILGFVFSCLLSSLSPVVAHPVGFSPLDQRMVGNPSQIVGGAPGCSQEIHDLYVTTGPDGQKYRTWHALWHPRVKGQLLRRMPTWKELEVTEKAIPECYFAHEHGQPPLALVEPRSGAPLPAFGYAEVVEHAVNPSRETIEPHPGFKVFTYLARGSTGWKARAPVSMEPDGDYEIMIHQGVPSLFVPGSDTTATRVTQRFHEMTFYARLKKGGVTHIIKMADTGTAAFRGYSAGGRIIATEREPFDEVWNFQGHVGSVFMLTFAAEVRNPMNHFVGSPPVDVSGVNQADFASSAERFERLPFGDHRSGVHGFMGTIRTLNGIKVAWNNTTGEEWFCTDPYGAPRSLNDCKAHLPGTILQRIMVGVSFDDDDDDDKDDDDDDKDDDDKDDDDKHRRWRKNTNIMTTAYDDRKAFPTITSDPSRPWGIGKPGKCKSQRFFGFSCVPRIPQDFPMGN